MTRNPPFIELLAPDEYIGAYWNNLLSSQWSNQIRVGKHDVLMLRAAYRYEPVYGLGAVERRNLAGIKPDPDQAHSDKVFRLGEPGKEVNIVADETIIFIPVIDTVVFDKNAYSGTQELYGLDSMRTASNYILRVENDAVQPGHIQATISGLDGSCVPQDIDTDLLENRHTATFDLDIAPNSRLVSYMEYELIPNSYKATASGYYLSFIIRDQGRYKIRSQAFGVRNYISSMLCYVRAAVKNGNRHSVSS